MQLPAKYKENCDVSSKGPSSGVISGVRENYTGLFYTLLGFLCSYRGIYSIFPSNQFPANSPLYSIHLQCLCRTKNEKKQHHEGNMALRIISILTHERDLAMLNHS